MLFRNPARFSLLFVILLNILIIGDILEYCRVKLCRKHEEIIFIAQPKRTIVQQAGGVGRRRAFHGHYAAQPV